MTRQLLAIATVTGSLLLPFSAAQAQEALCATEDTTPKIAACLQKALEAQDRVLAGEVQWRVAEWRERDARDAMFKVAPVLEASQKAWEAYRAQACDARALTYGYGTGAGAEYSRCMIELSVQRQDELARHWN